METRNQRKVWTTAKNDITRSSPSKYPEALRRLDKTLPQNGRLRAFYRALKAYIHACVGWSEGRMHRELNGALWKVREDPNATAEDKNLVNLLGYIVRGVFQEESGFRRKRTDPIEKARTMYLKALQVTENELKECRLLQTIHWLNTRLRMIESCRTAKVKSTACREHVLNRRSRKPQSLDIDVYIQKRQQNVPEECYKVYYGSVTNIMCPLPEGEKREIPGTYFLHGKNAGVPSCFFEWT